jgi:hypothetical protein
MSKLLFHNLSKCCGLTVTPNGPAIWGGCVPAIGGVTHFLPSGYRVDLAIRVSRYRVVKVLVNYPGAVKFIEPVERLPRASKASDGGPDLSIGTILS